MLPSLVVDMPVIHFLREHGVDVVSAREEGWGDFTDGEILARAHATSRFVVTHDSDFGTLAVHRGEPITGILYLRPGGRPPAEVSSDLGSVDESGVRLDATAYRRKPSRSAKTPSCCVTLRCSRGLVSCPRGSSLPDERRSMRTSPRQRWRTPSERLPGRPCADGHVPGSGHRGRRHRRAVHGRRRCAGVPPHRVHPRRPGRHRQAARREAVHRLHRTARQLADASDRELGPLLEISEDVSPDYGPFRNLSAGAAMLRSEAADTPMSVGGDVIRVTVSGVFALR